MKSSKPRNTSPKTNAGRNSILKTTANHSSVQKTTSTQNSIQKTAIGQNSNAAGPKFTAATPFRMAYERHDIPIRIDHTFRGPKLKWIQDISSLDYNQYLPLFCEGLIETKFPYDFLAEDGVIEMISAGPDKVLPVVPYLIQPLKSALKSNNSKTIIKTLKIIQQIVKEVAGAGEALIPYYRQLLPVLGQYKTKNKNLGDGVEYGQYKNENLADLIEETLNVMEINGGPDAFINIRYVIPLYESCTGSQ